MYRNNIYISFTLQIQLIIYEDIKVKNICADETLQNLAATSKNLNAELTKHQKHNLEL